MLFVSREQLLADLMKETDDIASKRKAFREMKELLLRAIDIVNEVSDPFISGFGAYSIIKVWFE